ncbi:PTI1-like tyrosine-protein kinase At3g15890 isoform X1 [Dendrobium catenatum]|uniref:PTI1-like tyrosine-protein kinase At3g15890 isoform X1 n=1 Tax=Dendrobium catenatum TaxID=906689 RepID=UPI0009F56EB7|nr:PTI1-like tyrosine-protein kinase At3g15890 isoform X1 [Dendrobium catenatum]
MVNLRKFCCLSRKNDEEAAGRSCPSSRTSSSSCFADQPWEIFSLKQLLNATNNFNDSNKLGEGGFGAVYWGRTPAGGEIAVKRLKAMSPKAEMEFAVEVEVLGRVRHKNLLSLRGYFAGGEERLIVYDYMPNRSLLGHLHGRRSYDYLLDWRTRLRIALGSASGIAYLHHEASPHIIHRDIKASNVLLDAKFRPKVADFGFAKLIPDGVSHLTTRVKGTLGYLAPEYAMWGKVSESCDVYSFGILLLEIVSARRPIEKLPGGAKRDIVQWALPLAESGKWDQIADPRLNGRFDPAQLRNCVIVAIKCTDGCPENRPDMREVVRLLRAGIGSGRVKEVPAVDMVEEEKKMIGLKKKEKEKEKEEEEEEEAIMMTEPSDFFCIREKNESMIMR